MRSGFCVDHPQLGYQPVSYAGVTSRGVQVLDVLEGQGFEADVFAAEDGVLIPLTVHDETVEATSGLIVGPPMS